MTRHNEANRVALEHLAWCRRQGIRPAEIYEALGLWPTAAASGWDDLESQVGALWLRLEPASTKRAA